MTPEPTPLVTVLPCDRTAAWPFADFHCMPDEQMRERWFSGYYDTLSEGAAIRSMATHRLAALEAASPAMHLASNWLRACSDWLLSNDLDMKMPAGVLDADPLDIADALDAIRSLSQPVEGSAGNDVVALRTSVDEDVIRASHAAEKRFCDLEPERAERVDRIMSMYTFDTEADRCRAHECCRAISGHGSAGASVGPGNEECSTCNTRHGHARSCPLNAANA